MGVRATPLRPSGTKIGDVEIIDAQVHLNHIHPEWKTAELEAIFAAALAAMDAVGVDGLVVSEFWGFSGGRREELPNGVFRSRYPFSELAAARSRGVSSITPWSASTIRSSTRRSPEIRQQPGGGCTSHRALS